MLFVDIVIVLALILLNGFLAMSELAVVSARRSQLKVMAQEGHRGAAGALHLLDDPGRFLSTVQIGITTVGVLTGAFSGATIADLLAERISAAGVSSVVAQPAAMAIVVTVITFVTLIVGELVPKRLALLNPGGLAAAVARAMLVLARITAPAVWLLDRSSRLVLRLIKPAQSVPLGVTEAEIGALIAEAEAAGVVEPAEKQMVVRVLRLGDRSVRAFMTPRPQVDWIDLEDDEATIRATLRESRHSRLLASRGAIDEVAGILQAKDVLNAYLVGGPVDFDALLQRPVVVHEGVDALEVIETLRKAGSSMALVVDEYGSFHGVVTTADILAAIVGNLETIERPKQFPAVQRDDGSWLLEGAMPIDEMADLLDLVMPERADFHTVAGFVLAHLRHLPTAGESFQWGGWRFEVVDMDGRRVDKVLASLALVLHRP